MKKKKIGFGRGVRIGAAASLLLLASGLASAATDMLVSAYDNSIRRFDGATGAFKGNFVAPGAGGLNGANWFTFGPDGNLYVSSIQTQSVKRYNGTTGAYIDDFVPAGSGGGISPDGLAFGPDGNLYISNGAFTPGKVTRHNGVTGAYMDDFVPPGSGGLLYGCGLAFGPDGNLYVVDQDRPVHRYDGKTGAYLGDVTGTFSSATSITFASNGDMYISDFYGQAVKRFNGTTFALIATLPISWPFDVRLGPDGNLYAVSRYSGTVQRFDPSTNASLGTFASTSPEILTVGWFPSPVSTCQTSLSAAQQTIQQLQAQVASLSSLNTSLQNQFSAAQSQVASLTAANTALQSQVSTLTAQNTALQSQVATLNAQNTALQSQLTGLAQLLAAVQADFQTTFTNPGFTIAGATLVQQYQSLVTGIIDLNRGDKMGIYRNLGGK